MVAGQPKLYVCYGMAKAGSTLAFHLTREIALAGGLEQPMLPEGARPGKARINYMPQVKPARLKPAFAAVEAAGLGPVVIKTHGGVWAQTARHLADGSMIGQAVCRDPRDLALSLLDAARKDAAWSGPDGIPFQTYEDTMELVRAHVSKFEHWAAQPNILTFNYEALAFDTATVAARIADQLGVEVELNACIAAARDRFTQFNKGRPHRHKEEMHATTADYYGHEFQDFIDKWC